MQHRFCAETIDRMLQDIRDDKRPFGGITVAFGGDFRQILPVVIRGSQEDIVAASLRPSYLWHHVHVLNLTINMRLNNGNPEDRAFAKMLLNVSMGVFAIASISDTDKFSVGSIARLDRLLRTPCGYLKTWRAVIPL